MTGAVDASVDVAVGRGRVRDRDRRPEGAEGVDAAAPPLGCRGFTLMEMIVALLVVGLVMGIAVVGVNTLTSARLREDAGRMAAVIRALYARAATMGRTYRMVFDIDQGRYHAEYTTDPVLLSQERERPVRGGKPEEDRERRRGLFGIGPETPRLPEPGWKRVMKNEIGLFEDDQNPEVKLAGDVEIEGVFTTHQVDLYTRGRCELYFFPGGWTEPAFIYLREKGREGDVYTLEVEPLTGRVTIHPDRLQIPSEWREERDKEEEGERIF